MTPRQYEAAVARAWSPKGRKRTHAKRQRRELNRVGMRHGVSWMMKVAHPQQRIERLCFDGFPLFGLLRKDVTL